MKNAFENYLAKMIVETHEKYGNVPSLLGEFGIPFDMNGEDLSVFSLSQQKAPDDINSGGRALEAAIRPYPRKIPGKLLEYGYDYQKKEMCIWFKTDKLSKYPVEVFVPTYIYGDHFEVYSSKGVLSFDKNRAGFNVLFGFHRRSNYYIEEIYIG